MMVEKEFFAEELEKSGYDEDVVGGIAGMQCVKAPYEKDFPGKSELLEQGNHVFGQISDQAAALYGQGIAMNMDAVDAFVPCLEALAGGANDRDAIAGFS
jgi:hypothetical protein